MAELRFPTNTLLNISRATEPLVQAAEVKRQRQLDERQVAMQREALDLRKQMADLRREEIGFNRKIKEAELGLKFADLQLKQQGGGFKDKKQKADVTAGLRKELASRSKDFTDIRDAIGRVRASKDDAAGDIALIFNYMKMLDPGSVIRESEFATAENAAGVPQRVRVTWNKLKAGERLAPEQRELFKNQAEALFQDQAKRQTNLIESFGGIADRWGLDKRDIFADLEPDTGSGQSDDSSSITTPKNRKIRIIP